MGSSCEHGNATSGFVKDREFLDLLGNYSELIDGWVGCLVVLFFS